MPNTAGETPALPGTAVGTAARRRGSKGVALVITLLMLSVITFLTIAFLAMSRQNKAAVSASLDVAAARAASDAALARAQAEIMANMLAHGDALAYDYMVSRNYESPSFTNGNKIFDPNNVNYDFLANTATRNSSSNNPLGWAQNIANLFYDPRPPVFVATDPQHPNNFNDFRFYVDVDRNGEFETNGDQPIVNDLGVAIGSNAVMNGEPEWIGQLRNPLLHHSGSNTFINRYAYLVLPIGKTLDLNYMGNSLKGIFGNTINPPNNTPNQNDGFARDQGIGSWELNLAGLLEAVSPWAYESNNASYGPFGYTRSSYSYFPPNASSETPNTGNAFDDAAAILHFRYGNPSYILANLQSEFPTNYLDFGRDNIDMYCVDAPVTAPFDYSNSAALPQRTASPWAGSYPTNLFYDPQDLFDPNKTSSAFINRMILASQRTNTFDRYTFLRLLSSAGTGSSPEYGVWVYGDSVNTNPPLVLRTKVNINYDNTAQITNINAPYAPMPTILAPWNATSFFTNAADLLLRSKIFTFTNMAGTNSLGTTITATFGVTDIPVYRTNNPGIRYDEGIHRMLQVAANIYDCTRSNNFLSPPGPVRHPTIFRPRFGLVGVGTPNVGVDIIGYVQVTNATIAYKQILSHNGFKELPAVLNDLKAGVGEDDNAWGVPWVVAAEKGLPQFNQYSYNTRALFTRKLLFVRGGTPSSPITNKPPIYTNQFFCMSISNSLGMDAWNPYPTNFLGAAGYTTCYISNYITIQVTNNYNFGFSNFMVNVKDNPAQRFSWSPYIVGQSAGTNAGGFISFFPTNITSLQAAYFSEANRNLVFFTNGIISSNGFRLADMQQTGWPTHNWTINITNHLVYVLFDGTRDNGAVLDFVNLGPFGTSFNFSSETQSGNSILNMGGGGLDPWAPGNATDFPGSPMSQGMINQIITSETNTSFNNALNGSSNSTISSWAFGTPYDASLANEQLSTWVANDPLVHYTADDLNWPGHTPQQATPAISLLLPVTNNLGTVSARYSPWGASDTIGKNMLFKDPLVFSPTNWAFPTNKFPGVGWIGRVHRGTPWQTVYLKADSATSLTSQNLWTSSWVSSPETYPTNDWSFLDLFTAAPNDNAARGLLSVNQLNDAAWAAVFAGVIAPTNQFGGTNISPLAGVQFLMDSPNGINNQRTNYPNGIFHKIGDILGASALTTTSPYLIDNSGTNAFYSDDIVERIPQQTLSLLKVGEPQFVIYAWGQALKPKGAPYLTTGPNYGMYTNYEITGESLTRTVCHLVHTNGLKMVVDSFNVESGNP